jgi:hypothetical protein
MRRLFAALSLVALASSSLAAGRELAARRVGPSPYIAQFPAVAFASGRFLTVWREERQGLGTHIFGSFSDASGKRVSTEAFPVVLNANPDWIRLVATGDSYALFWGTSYVRTNMADLDAEGRVTAKRVVDLPPHITRDIAWNGMHFLAAMKHPFNPGHKAEAVLFTRDGQIVRRGIAIDDMLFTIDVVVAGDSFVVLTAGWNGLFSHRVSSDGRSTQTLLSSPSGTSLSTRRALTPIAAGREDGSVLAVWSDGSFANEQMFAAVIDAAGALRTVHEIIGGTTGLSPVHLRPHGEGYELTFVKRIRTETAEEAHVLYTATLDSEGRPGGTPVEWQRLGPWVPAAASSETVTLLAYPPPYSQWLRIHQLVVGTTTPDIVSLSQARHLPPALGAGGGRYLAAFTEHGETLKVRTVAIAADGAPLGTTIVANDALLVTRDLPWNGNEYLAVYSSAGQRFAQRLTIDGAASGDSILLGPSEEGTGAAATWAIDRWVVVWGSRMTTISSDGRAGEPRELPVDPAMPTGFSRYVLQPAIATRGTRVVVVWIESRVGQYPFPSVSDDDRIALAMTFRRDGTPIDDAPRVLADRPLSVAVASSGEETVVVTNLGAEAVATVVESGLTRRITGGTSDILWDGREYVVASRHRPDWTQHLVVTRFDRALNETAAPRATVTLRSEFPHAPSIASVSAGDILAAIAEGQPVTGGRAVVYLEREMEPLPESAPRRRSVR